MNNRVRFRVAGALALILVLASTTALNVGAEPTGPEGRNLDVVQAPGDGRMVWVMAAMTMRPMKIDHMGLLPSPASRGLSTTPAASPRSWRVPWLKRISIMNRKMNIQERPELLGAAC